MGGGAAGDGGARTVVAQGNLPGDQVCAGQGGLKYERKRRKQRTT